MLFYDPVQRVVATLHPDHSWDKSTFNPWRQETSDVSDTVLIADPKTDADVGDFFRRLPDADYLPTWYAQRQGGALDPQEEARRQESGDPCEYPPPSPMPSRLGRTFLTVAHNKFKYSDTPSAGPPAEEFYRTRVVFDIEGNQREVIDAKDRVVMRYDYDILGKRIDQSSVEAGQRWMLSDVAGKPLYYWDSRDAANRHVMDRAFSFDIPGDFELFTDGPRAGPAIDFCHNVISIVCVVFRLASLRKLQILLERHRT